MSNEFKYLDVAERVLLKHRRPMKAAELVSFGLDDGFVESWESKTPQKSMQSRLSVDILKNGKASRFVRTKKGLFFLRNLIDKPLTLEQPFLTTSFKKSAYLSKYEANPRIATLDPERVLTIHQDHYRDKLNFQGYQKCNEKDLRELLALNQSKWPAPGMDDTRLS